MKFIWPLADHYITRGFDFKSSIYIGGQHAAVDLVRLQGDTAGREILAVADGVVTIDAQDDISGYHIAIEHADGWRSMYRHLVADAPPVIGQQIAQGQTIGNVGSTGMSTGPHLHFDLWHLQKQDDTAFSKSGWWAHNPELYLGKEDDMALDPVKDKATFEKMLRSVLSRTEVIAIKDDGKTTGGYASLGLNIFRVRQNERHAKDATKHAAGDGLKRGDEVILS